MCAVFGAYCGTAARACHCLSLRAFAIGWLIFSILIAILQLVAGSYISSARGVVDSILEKTKDSITHMGDPSTAMKYYDVISSSLTVLWRAMGLLTTFRGIVDLVAVACWCFGWWRKKWNFMYAFVGIMGFDFIVDFILFVSLVIALNVLYITYFYPIAVIVPFLVYGWQVIAGPYIIHLLISYVFVLGVGGDGTEKKDWKQVKELRDKVDQGEVMKGKSETEALLSNQGSGWKGTADDDTAIGGDREEIVTGNL